MKKIIILIIAIAIIPSFSFSQDLNLEKILKKHYKVMNYKKMKDMNTISMEGNVMAQGMELPFSQVIKRPNKTRMEIDIQGSKMITAFNGEKGWMINPFAGGSAPMDMDEDQAKSAKEQADIEGILWNWKDKADSLELIGKEDLDGTQVYKLKLTEKASSEEEDAKGGEQFIFIDAEEFTITKRILTRNVQGADMEIEVYQGDFKKVDGFLTVHTIEQKMGGQTISKIIIEKVEFNKDFEDSLFEKPE